MSHYLARTRNFAALQHSRTDEVILNWGLTVTVLGAGLRIDLLVSERNDFLFLAVHKWG